MGKQDCLLRSELNFQNRGQKRPISSAARADHEGRTSTLARQCETTSSRARLAMGARARARGAGAGAWVGHTRAGAQCKRRAGSTAQGAGVGTGCKGRRHKHDGHWRTQARGQAGTTRARKRTGALPVHRGCGGGRACAQRICMPCANAFGQAGSGRGVGDHA